MSEAPHDREERESHDAQDYASGGPVTGVQPYLIGEHNCHQCGHRPDIAPLNVTVNVHGSVNPDEIERIVRDIIRRMTQRRPPYGG